MNYSLASQERGSLKAKVATHNNNHAYNNHVMADLTRTRIQLSLGLFNYYKLSWLVLMSIRHKLVIWEREPQLKKILPSD